MQNQPTAQQLRMLVQQIQMAVQAGYLNHQILNQPLAPQTLIMLNQLLQQIKILQQNVQIQAAVANNPKSGPAMVTAAIAINKARQQIASLQVKYLVIVLLLCYKLKFYVYYRIKLLTIKPCI